MTSPSLLRPLLAALATGFPAGAAATLLLGDAGDGSAAWLATLATGLCAAALAAGAAWRRWRAVGGLAVASPFLGLLGASVPMGLLLGRTGWLAAGPEAAGGLPWPAMLGLFPTALLFGLTAPFVLGAGRGQPGPAGRPAFLPLALAVGAGLGVAFAAGLASRLTPCNLALDVTLGCAALGIACAAGTSDRRFETWLSVLALLAILGLPLSRLVDDRTRPWLPGAAATAMPATATPGALPPSP